MKLHLAAVIICGVGLSAGMTEDAKVLTGEAPAKSEAGDKKAPASQWLTSKDAADKLSAEDLKKLIELLRANSTQAVLLTDEQITRATIHGLLDRLGTGARIVEGKPQIGEEPGYFHHEMLPCSIAYVRLGAITEGTAAALDKALDELVPKTPRALILDLRDTAQDTDFHTAAEISRRFAPKGRVLFTIKRAVGNEEEMLTSNVEPRWNGLTVVLVDADTAGAGEVIAAVLRTHLGAYIIGQQTQGEAAQYKDLSLDGNRTLRVAVGEVALTDKAPVFPDGLKPDLVLDISQKQTDELLAGEKEKGISVFLAEKERHRMNEAALVAGTNPELDEMQESQSDKGKKAKPTFDVALQRAVDFITAVGVFEVKKR